LNQLIVEKMPFDLCEEFDRLNLRLVASTEVVAIEIDSTLSQDIRKGQLTDEKIQEIKQNIKEGKSPGFIEDEQGVLWYKGRIYVPDVKEIKKLMILLILFTPEAIRCINTSRFSISGME
jgi:hypothetical protein